MRERDDFVDSIVVRTHADGDGLGHVPGGGCEDQLVVRQRAPGERDVAAGVAADSDRDSGCRLAEQSNAVALAAFLRHGQRRRTDPDAGRLVVVNMHLDAAGVGRGVHTILAADAVRERDDLAYRIVVFGRTDLHRLRRAPSDGREDQHVVGQRAPGDRQVGVGVAADGHRDPRGGRADQDHAVGIAAALRHRQRHRR